MFIGNMMCARNTECEFLLKPTEETKDKNERNKSHAVDSLGGQKSIRH